jgi:hypothetical protein
MRKPTTMARERAPTERAGILAHANPTLSHRSEFPPAIPYLYHIGVRLDLHHRFRCGVTEKYGKRLSTIRRRNRTPTKALARRLRASSGDAECVGIDVRSRVERNPRKGGTEPWSMAKLTLLFLDQTGSVRFIRPTINSKDRLWFRQ